MRYVELEDELELLIDEWVITQVRKYPELDMFDVSVIIARQGQRVSDEEADLRSAAQGERT